MRVDRQLMRRVPMGRAAARRAGVVLLGVVLLGAAACTPEAAPTPTPTPTFSCSVNVGECTLQQAEKEAKAAKDHTAAELSLRSGLAEYYRILGEPSAKTGTAELERHLAEDELKSAVGAIQSFRERGRVGHGAVSIINVAFVTKYPNSMQDVVVCEDGAKYYTTDEQGKNPTAPGVRLKYTATLRLIDERWKLAQSTSSAEVNSCED